jgi:hypothetical protein
MGWHIIQMQGDMVMEAVSMRRWHKSLFSLFYFLVGCFFSGQNAQAIEYRAFSMRQADKLSSSGQKNIPELSQVGGITYLVGLVHDRDNKDLVLVGLVCPGPPILLDDIVVAMRSRLLIDEWPKVSIEPTIETVTNRQQDVVFKGGITDTPYGAALLDCDVVLKKYALGLSELASDVPPYKELCETDLRERIRREGSEVLHLQWFPIDKIPSLESDLRGCDIISEHTHQVRFWFYPLDESRVTELDGVFVIHGLVLGIRTEVYGTTSADAEKPTDMNADQFARNFISHFSSVAAKYPILRRLPALYQLAAISESMAKVSPDERPELSYFIEHYQVPRSTTPRKYKLIEYCCVADRSDGRKQVLRLCGGVEISTLVEELNSGNSAALRTAVLGSRPSHEALSWSVPIAGWKIIEEGFPLIASQSAKVWRQAVSDETRKEGCVMSNQEFVIERPSKIGSDYKKFFGFPPPPPPPPGTASSGRFTLSFSNKLPTLSSSPGGISMKMTVFDESFRLADRDIESLRDDILKSMGPNTLCSPVIKEANKNEKK